MEIYAYGNVQAIVGALHFLVMLFGSTDFLDIVKTVIVIGFIVAAMASVFQMTHRGWRWIVSVLVIYSIFFIPKTQVLVTDKLAIQPPALVADVPWFAGFAFAVKSQIGHTLVQLTETALQTIPNPLYAMPAELSYEQHGVAFGNRLIHASRDASIPDVQLRADLIGYFRNCVYPEIGKSLDPDVLASSTNLWGDVNVLNAALVTPYTPPLGTVQIDACPTVYGLITARLPAVEAQMLSSYAMNLVPGLTPLAAVGIVDPALFAAYTKAGIAGASASASAILLNNAMLNHFGETGQIMNVAAADPASVLLALAKQQAVTQTNASNAVQAQMAELANPVVRNVLEVVLLGAFPIVFLMMLVTEGTRTVIVLIGYLYALVWIELWPFTFAILNYVHTLFASQEAAAAGYMPGLSGMSLLTSGKIYSTTLTTSGIAGWMIVAVPTLSAALLWGFDKIVGAVPSVGAMFGTGAGTVAQSATGNISQGNVTTDQRQLSPQTSSAFFSSVQNDQSGNFLTGGALSDVLSVRALQNDTYLAGSLQAQRATSLLEQASHAGEVAMRESAAASSALTAGWGDALTQGRARATVQELGTVVGLEVAKSDAARWQEIVSTADTYNRRWGLGEQQAAAIVASAKAGFALEVGALAQLSNEQRAAIKRDYDQIQGASKSQDFARTQDFLRRLSSNEQYRNATVSRQEDRDELSATFHRARSHVQGAEASLVARDGLTQSAQAAYSRAVSLGYDFAKDPANTPMVLSLMQRIGGDPARAQLVLDSEMARFHHLTRPTEYLDGRSVVDSPSGTYEQLKKDPKVTDDTAVVDARNRAKLQPGSTAPVAPGRSLAGTTNEIEGARQTLQKKERDLHGEVQRSADRANFQLNRRDPDPDGKFATKTSLTIKAGENAVNDVVDTSKELLEKNGVLDRKVKSVKNFLVGPPPRQQ